MLSLLAILICVASVFITNKLVKELKSEETKKIEIWAQATKQLVNSYSQGDFSLAIKSDQTVVEKLKEIFDPEIPVNIYDLGLIYDIVVSENGDVDILMTLTAPACPVAGTLPGEIAEKVSLVDNVGIVRVKITWDPPWTPENMSEVAKVALDMF